MSLTTEYSRMLLKRATTSGGTPTIPTGTTIDNTWLPTDIMVGELFMNTATDQLWTRTNNGIVEISLSGISSTNSYTNLAYLSGNTIQFGRTDIDPAYNVDLTPILAAGTGPWTAGTGTDSAVLIGSGSIASAISTVAMGYQTSATTFYSHAIGYQTTASGLASHAEGGTLTVASGDYSHAEGSGTLASGNNSHSEGTNTSATTGNAHAEGATTLASGGASHAEGSVTVAGGISAHAEGTSTTASGDYSHAQGRNSIASGTNSHAEGDATLSSGYASHSEGADTIATGTTAHAEGNTTYAYGEYSHSQNKYTTALGDNSHAGGSGNSAAPNRIEAGGDTSFIHFRQTLASGLSGAYGDYSTILGGTDHNIGTGATSSAIFGGDLNIVDVDVINSVVLGGVGITADTSNTVYTPNLNIGTLGGGASVNTLGIDTNGNVVTTVTANNDDIITGATQSDINGGTITLDAPSGSIVITGVTGGAVDATKLPLTGGTMTGNIAMANGVDITGNGGNNVIDLQGNLGQILVSTDNGAKAASFLELGATSSELSCFGGDMFIYADDSLAIGRKVSGTTLDEYILIQDGGIELYTAVGQRSAHFDSSDVFIGNSISSSAESGALQVRNNASTTKSTAVGVVNRAVFIGAQNSQMNASVINSVVMGTDGITGTTSNTTYVQNLDVSGNLIGTPCDFSFAVSDETTQIVTGTTTLTFFAPYAMTITDVYASLSVTGSTVSTFDINNNGTTILSTKITVDANEFHSNDATTPPVISTAAVAQFDKLTVDIDTAGTLAAGAKIYIVGNRT